MRLRKASELIISTNDSFQEICYAVGFTDYSNFSKEFKRNSMKVQKIIEIKSQANNYQNNFIDCLRKNLGLHLTIN